MEEPNKSALVLLQHEATELLVLFDRLRGDALLAEPNTPQVALASTRPAEQASHVTI